MNEYSEQVPDCIPVVSGGTLGGTLRGTLRGILFDKDGTLLDFKGHWGPVLFKVAEELAPSDRVLWRMTEACGFVRGTDKLNERLDVPFASGSGRDVAELWQQILIEEGGVSALPCPVRHSPGSPYWVDAVEGHLLKTASYTFGKPVTDLARLFRQLRADGMKIGIASMDSEKSVRTMISDLNLTVDFYCGADSGIAPKPAADMANAFCQMVGLEPSQVVMVGDSYVDMVMAKNAKLGLAIGVLTGVCGSETLLQHADIIVSSVDSPEFYKALSVPPLATGFSVPQQSGLDWSGV